MERSDSLPEVEFARQTRVRPRGDRDERARAGPGRDCRRGTPATISAFQQTTRRRPFAEDRRRGTFRSITCAGGQGCRLVPSRPRRGRPPASAPARHPMEAPNGTSTDKAEVTRASARKVAAVTHLAELLSRATSAVVTDYRGLTVRQLEDLRGKLRAEGIDYMVVKNTLARRAAVDAGSAGLRRRPQRAGRPRDRIRGPLHSCSDPLRALPLDTDAPAGRRAGGGPGP